jgi:hypothetical protein
MGKRFFIPIILCLTLIFSMSFCSSFFTWEHDKTIVQGFNEVNGAGTIADLCRNYEDVFIDGQVSADAEVVHYYDTGANSQITSYISTHTKGAGVGACLLRAGSDVRKECYCYGMGIHSIQDQFSHLSQADNGITDGLVVKYLKLYVAPNFIGHMTIENNFDLQIKDKTQKENPTLFTQTNNYNSRTLNTLFTTDLNGNLVPSDLMQLFSESSGIPLSQVTNDVQVFRSGYLGQGFYSSVYKDKVRLPLWGYYIPAIICLMGIIGALSLIFLGRNKFKYLATIPWIFLIVIGGIIFYSYVNGTTWQITTTLIEVPASLGYLHVSDADITSYDNLVQKAVNQYLKDGKLTIQDASGLDYVDSNGVAHKGALNQASTSFFWLFWLVGFPLIIGILIWSIYRSFKRSKRR